MTSDVISNSINIIVFRLFDWKNKQKNLTKRRQYMKANHRIIRTNYELLLPHFNSEERLCSLVVTD